MEIVNKTRFRRWTEEGKNYFLPCSVEKRLNIYKVNAALMEIDEGYFINLNEIL